MTDLIFSAIVLIAWLAIAWYSVRYWRRTTKAQREHDAEFRRKFELCQRDPEAYLLEVDAENAVRELINNTTHD